MAHVLKLPLQMYDRGLQQWCMLLTREALYTAMCTALGPLDAPPLSTLSYNGERGEHAQGTGQYTKGQIVRAHYRVHCPVPL